GTSASSEEQNPLQRLDAGVPLVSGNNPGPPPKEDCPQLRFGVPELLTGNKPAAAPDLDVWAPSLSNDGSTLWFALSTQPSVEYICYATRADRGSVFSEAKVLVNVNSGSGEGAPVLSNDGLRLYFYSRRPGGSGDGDLWWATRASRSADFEAPSRFVVPNSAGLDHLPWLSPDELTLLYVSTRADGLGEADVWVARRAQLSSDFGAPELFTAISTNLDEGRAVESRDRGWVVFASARDGGQG